MLHMQNHPLHEQNVFQPLQLNWSDWELRAAIPQNAVMWVAMFVDEGGNT